MCRTLHGILFLYKVSKNNRLVWKGSDRSGSDMWCQFRMICDLDTCIVYDECVHPLGVYIMFWNLVEVGLWAESFSRSFFQWDYHGLPLASDERSDLIFFERTSRRYGVLGLSRPLLPKEVSVSVNIEFQDSMLRTELVSESESESSFESHSMIGNAFKLVSKFKLNSS